MRVGLTFARVLFPVHVDGALQAELAVFEHDRVFVLRDAVDRPVESPVEENAGGLAVEARIVFALEIRRGFFSGCGQFGSAIEPRPARRARVPDTPPAGRSPGL